MLLSLDLGTTHSKAGLFTMEGDIIRFARHPTSIHQEPSGSTFYDPEEMWTGVINNILQILNEINSNEISAIGISSMAETGLLVDKQTGKARSHLLPWHDASSVSQVKELTGDRDPLQQFIRSGIRPNFKCSLSKLLWIRDTNPGLLEGTTWLSTADYISFRLSGKMATDYSLAGRTYAFQIDDLTWDGAWLEALHLPADIFPPAVPSGQTIGKLTGSSARLTGLQPGTPISICGHDHVCAAFATVGSDSGQALDSMGTAEALVGSLDKEKLDMEEYQSGLVFGRHVAGGGYYWMGGMSSSGGSIDWLRNILGDPALSYQDLAHLLENISPNPTGILFFPYLAGSGSPHTDIHVRGAFIGLDQSHDRSDLIKAVLEGTAFEAEFIRQAAQGILIKDINSLKVSGGGTNISQWMQIKADVSGCEIEVSTISEATLLGAALVAGIGSGIYQNEEEARSSMVSSPDFIYQPSSTHHQMYQQLYQEGFLTLQKPLRHLGTKTRSSFFTTKR